MVELENTTSIRNKKESMRATHDHWRGHAVNKAQAQKMCIVLSMNWWVPNPIATVAADPWTWPVHCSLTQERSIFFLVYWLNVKGTYLYFPAMVWLQATSTQTCLLQLYVAKHDTMTSTFCPFERRRTISHFWHHINGMATWTIVDPGSMNRSLFLQNALEKFISYK